jgi:hypothetical protein
MLDFHTIADSIEHARKLHQDFSIGVVIKTPKSMICLKDFKLLTMFKETSTLIGVIALKRIPDGRNRIIYYAANVENMAALKQFITEV